MLPMSAVSLWLVYRYTLSVGITDFTGEQNLLMARVLI